MTDSVFGTPDEDGWYEWKGDDMVRPAGIVDVSFRDGVKSCDCPADVWEWKHMHSASDIVKWRPAQ